MAGSIARLCDCLRIIVAMTAAPLRQAATLPAVPRRQGGPLGKAVLAALVLLLIGPGIYPGPLLTLIRATAAMVVR